MAHGLFDAPSQAETGSHTFLYGGDKESQNRMNQRKGCLSHLEWDPLVLASFTESVSEEEDIIHSNSQSQEGQHLYRMYKNNKYK